MIRQIYELNDSYLTDTYYGKKIKSYIDAYGTHYDFCRLYSLTEEKNGIMLIYNSMAVIDGEFDSDEVVSFLEILSLSTIEVSGAKTLELADVYKRKRRTMYKMKSFENNVSAEEVCCNASLDKIYGILRESFGIMEYDSWYADISHRIRHGIAKIYLYHDTTATIQFASDDFAFASHIATSESGRGKGTARNLLYYVCAEYEKSNQNVFLWSLEHRKTFYEGIGFTSVDNDILYETE